MPDLVILNVGDLNPSIEEYATINGAVQNLTGKTARFKMRAVNSTVLKVNQPVSNVLDTTGFLRYDWVAGDTDTADRYLVWWEITTTGKPQSIGEAVIEVRAHALVRDAYVELEQFKRTVDLQGTSYADLDIQQVLAGASRAIDNACRRRFYKDTVDATRYFVPLRNGLVLLDDLASVTSVATDSNGDGTYATSWTQGTDYVFGPENASVRGWPYTTLETHSSGRYSFPYTSIGVRVVGKYGWPGVPDDIRVATTILAHRWLKRVREAPLGVAGAGLDGAAVRVPTVDPDVRMIVSEYVNRSFV